MGMRKSDMWEPDDKAAPEQRQKQPTSRMRLFVTGLWVVVAAIWAGLAFSAEGEIQAWYFLLVALFLLLAAISFLSFRKSLRRKDGPNVDLGHP